MWMTQYINEVRKQFRDKYNFIPTGGTDAEPLFDNIPDGVYPMEIDGQIDNVRIEGSTIHCCQFVDITTPTQE